MANVTPACDEGHIGNVHREQPRWIPRVSGLHPLAGKSNRAVLEGLACSFCRNTSKPLEGARSFGIQAYALVIASRLQSANNRTTRTQRERANLGFKWQRRRKSMSARRAGPTKTGRASSIRRRSRSRSIRWNSWRAILMCWRSTLRSMATSSRNGASYGAAWRERSILIYVYCQAEPGFHALANRRYGEHVSRHHSRHAEDERLAREGFESHRRRRLLGAVLVQFPISFKNTEPNRDYLDT